ncbi:MAG: hypothetical protein ACI8UO_001648 [Verrucomicrobiales bacterium]|jgi:uncharacterized protein (DUF1501 family)
MSSSSSSPLTRRSALRFGASSALGLSLADLLRAEGESKKEGPAKSLIHLNLSGGFPAQESFDPKPEAPGEYRGPFNVAKTNTGEIFSEHFARTAKVADKLTVVRSCQCRIPDHSQATYHLFTGYLPTTVIDYPQMGAVVSQHFGQRNGLPPYVAVPGLNGFTGGTGYLSSKFGAFKTGADPGASGEFKVKDFSIPDSVSVEQFERRKSARQIAENHLRSLDSQDDTLATMDDFYQQAYTLLGSAETQAAFSLEDEPDHIRELYGSGYKLKYRNSNAAVNERLLLARRLVESGVRFVSIDYGGWDCHVDLRGTCEDKIPALDHAISGLVTDLDQRGLLDSTLFMVTTEFGRTPKMNKDNGRDHWARSYSMLLAGGGITRGQIYGASDATASEPARDPVNLEDFLYTVYHQLGIDANEELLAFGTRPIEIVKGGKLVEGLIA